MPDRATTIQLPKGLTQSEAWAILRKRCDVTRPFTYDPRTGACVLT